LGSPSEPKKQGGTSRPDRPGLCEARKEPLQLGGSWCRCGGRMYRTACVCLVCTGSARVPRVSTESVCTHRSLLCHAHGNTSCTTPCHFFSCSECRRSARVPPRSSVSSLIIPNSWPKLHSTSTCGRGLLFPHWSQLQVATHFSKLNCLLASTLNLPLPQPSLPWTVSREGDPRGNPFLPAPSHLGQKRKLLWLLFSF
jgi:hypothetical protein